MKKTNKTILLMAVVAALMFLAASCGATEDEMYTAKDFLFIKVDIDMTWISFGVLCMYLAVYWIGRFLVMREIREDYPSISYSEAEDYIMEYADSEWDKAKAENNRVVEFFWMGLRCGPFFCRVTPVMMVYSWFFDFVHLPYWIFTVLTCLALRFVPRWLGVDLSRFYNKWIVIWSIFCFVVLVTSLIVNKGGA